MKHGSLFILAATMPCLIALVLGLIPGMPHGPALTLGSACAWPLALVGALLVAWPPASLRVSAIVAAAAFVVRIGGAGAIAFLLLANHVDDLPAVLATMTVGIGAALLIEMLWWFRGLRRALAAEGAATAARTGDATHA